MWSIAQMRRRHHGAQVVAIGVWERKKVRGPGEGLVRLAVEDVQDGADEERAAGLLPMVSPFQRSFRVDQDVGDVLDVTDLGVVAPYLEQRVLGG